MSRGKALVELALKNQGGTQKGLAAKLGVSSTQVSKWKSDPGEHMSSEMEEKLKALAGLADTDHAEVIAWAGSLENARQWEAVFARLAEDARDGAEMGYSVSTLDVDEDLGVLGVDTVATLNRMGIAPPLTFPDDLRPVLPTSNEDLDGEDPDEDVEDDFVDNDPLNANPYTVVIQQIYASLANVAGFYSAYVNELTNEDELLDIGLEASDCLMQLAACKIEVEATFAPAFGSFKRKWEKQYREWIDAIKMHAFREGIPLRAELLDLLYEDAESLGHAAEREALGFNTRRLHPDVYMNELLVGMRVIHQVLPAIMKKLEIDEKTFRLDEDDLRVAGRALSGHASVDDLDEDVDDES
jgi:transcriptional regulator with XRE-family HTH domain